ncbi:hypothetical protein M407DRAFT_7406 [Tulasnella calospora MUT 4182]|uniref:Uncharacterized protein n=1 Tax=Tulasnella calospora MUT 4182 TaxID=1051891 RepID=A0A0C3M0R0_9AGAM|nr:hypothetical protein M407DRAFT_7406 [Tulasnella calospora MUT 4182]
MARAETRESNYWRRCRRRYWPGLAGSCNRHGLPKKTGKESRAAPNCPGDLATAGCDEEGVEGTPTEKSENATMTRGATAAATLPWSPQGDSAQVVVPQAAQPQESQALKPLPSAPSTQRTVPNNSDASRAQEHSAPQLSPQQVRLAQDLMDQGVPSPQVAGVVKSILASGSSSNTNATVASRSDTPGHAPDAPPQYDFKDTSTKGGN